MFAYPFGDCRMSHIPVVCDRQIFMSDKIDMVISVALPPVASLSAPMLVAKSMYYLQFQYSR